MDDAYSNDVAFTSKRDWWISASLWLGVLVMAAAVIPAALASGNLGGIALIGGFAVAVAAFMIWILYGTKYTFSGDSLVIQAGPFRWTVKVAAIRGAEPTNNPLSSPACSLDRLRIDYEGSRFGIMVSPLDKAGFLKELAGRNPSLAIENGRAVLRAT